jgi:hypothetical protein
MGIGVAMVFWWWHCSVMQRPWCELQVFSQQAFGVCDANCGGGGGWWKNWLCGGGGGGS